MINLRGMGNLLGVVLCGGESKRMGTDKGLKTIHNTIWAKFMADKLAFLRVKVVYAINGNQSGNYADYLPPGDLVVDDNGLRGPARGLLSAYNRFPADDIFLLACDMLELDELTITAVLKVYQAEKQYDYYVYQDEEFAQPFCGIYTSNGIAKLIDHIRIHSITAISMQQVLNIGYTKRIPIENKQAFTNFNVALR